MGTLWPVDGAGSVDGANGRAAHRPLENRRTDTGFPRPPTGRTSRGYPPVRQQTADAPLGRPGLDRRVNGPAL